MRDSTADLRRRFTKSPGASRVPDRRDRLSARAELRLGPDNQQLAGVERHVQPFPLGAVDRLQVRLSTGTGSFRVHLHLFSWDI